MMTACVHCHRRFIVRDQFLGRAARCTFCNERFLIEPRFSDMITLAGDEEELANSLNLPTLEDIEDSLQLPDVQAAGEAQPHAPVTLPPLINVPEVDYLEGHVTVASLLLLLFAAAVVVHGIQTGGEPAIAAQARADLGIEVAGDAWSRTWKPLLSRAGLMLIVVGPLFWAGAHLAAILLRHRYRSSGFIESLAIVSVPMTLPLLAIWSFGTDEARVVVPATVAAFPAVCLLVPAMFGMPLAKGVTTAAICIGVAAPGFIAVTLWAGSMSRDAIAADDARIAKFIEREKGEMAQRPATVPAATGAAAIARSLAEQITPEQILARQQAPAMPEAQEQERAQVRELGDVPAVPPAVVEIPVPSVTAKVAELVGAPTNNRPGLTTTVPPPPDAGTKAPAPATAAEPVAEARSESAPVGPPAPETSPAKKMHLEAWRDGGSPAGLIWPAASGSTFATVRDDRYGNHVLEFWRTDTLQRRGALRLGSGSGATYAICPAGETLLRVVNGASPAAELWSLAGNARRMQIPLPIEQADARALGFFDRQSFGLLSRAGEEAILDIYDTDRGIVRRRITWQAPSAKSAGAECTPENVAISPDGRLVAFVDATLRLRLIDVISGSPRKGWQLNLPRPESADVTAISFSPDGEMLALMLDESHSNNRAAIFCGPVQATQATSISFAEPIWKQAGCPRRQGTRVGRTLDWVGRQELLVYGELVLDAASGSVLASVHDRTDGAAQAALSQYPLAGGQFLLQYSPDAKAGRPPIQQLHLDRLRHAAPQ